MPRSHLLTFVAVVVVVAIPHVVRFQDSEPFFNNDETRHVMTGVFFRDLYLDRPTTGLREYTVAYYLQHPALGLLVWPPMFYAIEGLFMLVFGDSVLTAKLLIGLFAVVSCWYLFLLARRTHNLSTAAFAVLLFGLSPLVFTFSSHVMLEVPALTFVLAALFHFTTYLDDSRPRNLILACAATACAALTRFDGILLAPCFVLLLALRWRWDVLTRWRVWLWAAIAVLVTLPYFLLVFREVSSLHAQTLHKGTGGDVESSFLAPYNFLYYVIIVPRQVGWFATPAVVVGFILAFRRGRLAASAPYLALAGATYLTLSPLAELEPRHTLYWIPALSLFAADGLLTLGKWLTPRGKSAQSSVPSTQSSLPDSGVRPPFVGSPGTLAGYLLAGGLIAGTAWLAWVSPLNYLRGYEEAARYVVEHTTESPTCLFDNYLNGNFIYQVRRHDPHRRLWVLRGDKLFYSTLSDPGAGYTEHVRGEQDVLDLLYKYDPEYLVIEELSLPPDLAAKMRLPMAVVLRKVLREHPERFEMVKEEIALDSDYVTFNRGKLLIYHNLKRNPNRASALEFEMLGLGRSLHSPIPDQAPR